MTNQFGRIYLEIITVENYSKVQETVPMYNVHTIKLVFRFRRNN